MGPAIKLRLFYCRRSMIHDATSTRDVTAFLHLHVETHASAGLDVLLAVAAIDHAGFMQQKPIHSYLPGSPIRSQVAASADKIFTDAIIRRAPDCASAGTAGTYLEHDVISSNYIDGLR
jgi:hypothetical protein